MANGVAYTDVWTKCPGWLHWACSLQLCMWLVLLLPFDGTFTPPQDLAYHAGDDGNYGVSSDVTDLALVVFRIIMRPGQVVQGC